MKMVFILLACLSLFHPLSGSGGVNRQPGGIKKIKVACIGASITYGYSLPHPETQAYPQQLQRLLGASYQVTNYGVSGATMLRKGELSYWNTDAYRAALASQPDVVTIDLGGNDAQLVNRIHMMDFLRDARDMVRSFEHNGRRPRILLMLPFPSFETDTTAIYDRTIRADIIPRLLEVAREEQLEVVDMHTPFEDKAAWMPDRIHPDVRGAALTANILYRQLTLAGKGPAITADSYDVTFNEAGPGSSASMPLGNGDIGCNAWVDTSGDLFFYISKTDAWGGEKDTGADIWMQQGGVLMKLGLIQVSLNPRQRVNSGIFRQTLRPGKGDMLVTEGSGAAAVRYRLWVDANHPVIHLDIERGGNREVVVTLHDWRTGAGDTVVKASEQPAMLTWYHRNPGRSDTRLADPHLADITFGASIEGKGLIRRDDTALVLAASSAATSISIHPLTATVASSRRFLDRLAGQVAATDAIDAGAARIAHERWWNAFWDRSYIRVRGSFTADSVTRGYVLQRFVTACAGRGAYPIKFNGSLFVTDNPEWTVDGRSRPMNADFRAWGGQYWWQNTRPMYWPCLQAGDFDLMLPLFRMYRDMLPGNAEAVHRYYGHAGAYFQETSPFWGGLPFMGPGEPALYTHHYFTSILELSMMMLDYYDYTGDRQFARTFLLPVAGTGLTFFDLHFGRDSAGRLLLDPDNSIEMFWKVHDPAPDIAGLHAVIPRMLALPADIVPDTMKARWRRLLSILPPLPVDSERLLPYTGAQVATSHNEENPELYAIYPFRLYGLDKQGLSLARHSFELRKCPQKGCWSQDPIQAAILGYTAIAEEDVRYALTRKAPELKFPAFWATGHDYLPDEDNGGNGENGLQQMLLQADGKKLLLLPAWPADWDADFKLHAPYHTVVEGKVRNGRLIQLTVLPASRRADVVILSDK